MVVITDVVLGGGSSSSSSSFGAVERVVVHCHQLEKRGMGQDGT